MKMKSLFNIFLVLTIFVSQSNLFAAKSVEKPVSCSVKPKLTWMPVKDATSYKIIIKELNLDGTTSVKWGAVTTAAASYQVTATMSTGSLYKVKVKAKGVKADKLIFSLMPKEKTLVLNGLDFQPFTDESDYMYSFSTVSASSGNQYFRTSVLLPNGVTVYKIEAQHYESAGKTSTFSLRRQPVGTISTRMLGGFTSDGTGGYQSNTTTDIDSDNDTVDNKEYTYYFHLDLEASNRVQRVKIYYYGEKV